MSIISSADAQPVEATIAKVRRLLDLARRIKTETTVEPVLQTEKLSADLESLHDGFSEEHDQSYRFSAMEIAAREIFYAEVNANSITDPGFVSIWNLLDIILACGDHERCDPQLACYLLEELLDSQTTHGCRTVFDYLDTRRERLARKDFHKKNLIFLRSCNELLRRLSRAEDAIFCGRVFFFLFQTFPLGDKSSVNLRGEYHTENTTKFEIQDAESAAVESGPKQTNLGSGLETPAVQDETSQLAQTTKSANKAVIDASNSKKLSEEQTLPNNDLYPIFWSLQHDFSDPTRLFDEKKLSTFKSSLAYTIAKFKKTPTVVQTSVAKDDTRGTKRKIGSNSFDDNIVDPPIDNYNPKYLTSRDLFDLELSDLAFQRQILVQALILLDFLLSLTEKAKSRLAEASATNRTLLYSFTLSEDDANWAVSTQRTISEYLKSIGEGKGYERVVVTVLARDKNWVRWKLESCPSIVRGPTTTEDEIKARRGARDAVRPRRVSNKTMGAMDLSFLDEENDGGLEVLSNPARYTAPSIDQLVDRVKTDKLDLEMAFDDDEKYSLDNAIANSKWRALREARVSNLSLLEKIESSKDLEDMFRGPEQLEHVEHDMIEHNADETTPRLINPVEENHEDPSQRPADLSVDVSLIEEPDGK